MRESVPTARYSPVCNVLRQWKTSLILTYRVYRLYDNNYYVFIYIYIYIKTFVRRARAVNALRANVGPDAPVEVQRSI